MLRVNPMKGGMPIGASIARCLLGATLQAIQPLCRPSKWSQVAFTFTTCGLMLFDFQMVLTIAEGYMPRPQARQWLAILNGLNFQGEG